MKLLEYLEKNQITLSDHKTSLVDNYISLLIEANKRVNLISRKDEDLILENHFIPCLLFSKFIENATGRFLDIGTGGGLPGIIFSIINESCKGTLADSIAKKIKEVSFFIEKLGLKNVSAVCSRVEDKNFIEKNRDSFDVIISRATADLSTLIKYSKPLISKTDNSILLCLKGGELKEEIEMAKKNQKNIEIKSFPLKYFPNNIYNENNKYVLSITFHNDI